VLQVNVQELVKLAAHCVDQEHILMDNFEKVSTNLSLLNDKTKADSSNFPCIVIPH